MTRPLLHYLAMILVLIGGVLLFVFSYIWFSRTNNLMGAGMLVMGIIALSNFYLHYSSMKR